jgi:FkbM family methyltransferase
MRGIEIQPIIRRSRKAASAVKAFDNWGAVYAQFGAALVGHHLPAFHVRTRDGITVRAPHDRSALWPLLEVLAEDEYHLRSLDMVPEVIIDVGAHVGAFTCLAGVRYPNAEIVAVEPSRSALSWLRNNLEANRLTERTNVIEAAVTDHTGTVKFWDSDNAACDSSTEVIEGAHPVEVAALTFSDLLKQVPKGKSLLKIDCEGGEYPAILETPGDYFADIRALLIEYHPVRDSGFALLGDQLMSLGFHLAWSDPSGLDMGVAGFTRFP